MDRVRRALPSGNRLPITTVLSYCFDYAIIIILAVVYAALDKLVTPFSQRFSLNDITIQYPYAYKERIPIAEAIAISAGFPLLVIGVYTLAIDGIFSHRKVAGRAVYTFKERLWELNCGVLGLFLAQGAAFCITGTLKNLIGRPRPDLISRCLPQDGAQDQAHFGLSTKAICTRQDAYMMQDAFRSFPSGHASASFAGLFYLSLYLAGKLHLLDQRGEVWRTVVVVIPTMAAACIASSRIMDYRHHSFDVLFGSALGMLCGYAAYRQYFPPLTDSWEKGRAYPIREWGVPIRGPGDRQGYSTRMSHQAGDTMAADESSYAPERYQQRAMGQGFGLEPMRPRNVSSQVSEGFENVVVTPPGTEDTDYEHVRPKGESSLHPIEYAKQGGGNTFRDQIATNHSQRRNMEDHEEEDLGYSRPLIMTGKAVN